MGNTVVVIPVYKEEPDSSELVSLKRTLSLFSSYSIVFFGPTQLNTTAYEKLCAEANASFKYHDFEAAFFTGTDSYNRLLLSLDFYRKFADYTYMLVAQPDAYIFRNDLDEMLAHGYDYYGAPLIKSIENGKITYLFDQGGNGGFSLRKIDAAVRVLKTRKRIYTPSECWQELKKFHKGFELVMFIPVWFMMLLGFRNNVRWFVNRFSRNEDLFWTGYAKEINGSYNPAPVEIGIKFSWEKYAAELYELNNGELPMGCHAWLVHNPDFWKSHIPTT